MKGKCIFIDAEWFIGGQIFLLGYAKGIINPNGTAVIDKFHYAIEKNIKWATVKKIFTGVKYIFVYGPDIGIMQSHLNVNLKQQYICINLLKYFKHCIPNENSYKLASLETKFNIRRNVRKYKTNIFTIFRDWRNPRVRDTVIEYNKEDVVNLVKVYNKVKASSASRKKILLDCRLL